MGKVKSPLNQGLDGAQNTGESPKPRKNPNAWQPGQSGNPGGRPKADVHVRDLARQHTETAIATLVDVMLNGDKPTARAQAAEALLDRAWGRAPQSMELSGPDGGPIQTGAILPQDEVRRQLEAMGIAPVTLPAIVDQQRQEEQQTGH